MSSFSFGNKVRTMQRADLEQLVFKMEDQLLNVIDDEARLNQEGEILPADRQPDHVAEIMRLIEF